MLRLKFSIELNYQIDQPGCDFIFSIHAAQTPHQIVVSESLVITQNLLSNPYTDPVTHTRFLRLKAFAGPLT
ncbi:MAG: transglutaminase family protein, partial [Thiobacillaceae bacterium]